MTDEAVAGLENKHKIRKLRQKSLDTTKSCPKKYVTPMVRRPMMRLAATAGLVGSSLAAASEDQG